MESLFPTNHRRRGTERQTAGRHLRSAIRAYVSECRTSYVSRVARLLAWMGATSAMPVPEGTRPNHHEMQPMRVHTEFHRLVTELEDATKRITWLSGMESEYSDAYAELSQRRKELYEWVVANTPRPSTIYSVHIKF